MTLTVAALHELLYNDSGWIDWLLVLALIWPLVGRKAAPLLVLGVCLIPAALLWADGVFTVASAALLVALYSVAAHRELRQAVAATILLEASVVAACFRFAPAGSVDDAVLLLSGLVASALFLGTTMRVNRRYLAGLEDHARRLEVERSQQAELAAAAERTRIAREMHDIVAHGLAVVVTLSEGAAAQACEDPVGAREAMRQVAATGRQSLVEMRRLLTVLRDETPRDREPYPSLAGLDQLAAEARAAGLRVTVSRTGELGDLSPLLQVVIYRLVQEAFTNVFKHAPQARHVEVGLSRIGSEVGVWVDDDGGGQQPGQIGAGQGVAGMKERAAAAGGRVEAGPSPTGWSVHGEFEVG